MSFNRIKNDLVKMQKLIVFSVVSRETVILQEMARGVSEIIMKYV